jgi:UDP-2,3-diacylglucosamine hydrolase
LIEYMRRMSESGKQVKPMQIMDVTPAAVEQAFRSSGCTRLIHGHTHRPARHVVQVDSLTCERWVLADWHAYGQYLKVSPDGCESVDLVFAD